MRIYNGIDDSMVTKYVRDASLKYCSYCGGKCWKIGDYPYACRCSQCSAYFHRRFVTCDELEREGYDTCSCSKNHDVSVLRLFEISDGRLVEVCQGCADWLCEEGYIEELEVSDGEYINFTPRSCDGPDRTMGVQG